MTDPLVLAKARTEWGVARARRCSAHGLAHGPLPWRCRIAGGPSTEQTVRERPVLSSIRGVVVSSRDLRVP
jgi:hypothetical protein